MRVIASNIIDLHQLRRLHLCLLNDGQSVPRFALSHLLFNLKQLEELSLCLKTSGGRDWDIELEEVINMSPGLQVLKLEGMLLTDESLPVIAGLACLRHLEMHAMECAFSPDAIVSLLKGSARHALQWFSVRVAAKQNIRSIRLQNF